MFHYGLFVSVIILTCMNTGCQRPARPVFPEIAPAVEWPRRPDVPRVRYIGELTGEESLGKPRAWSFKELLAGPEPWLAFSTPTSVVAHGNRVYVTDGQNQSVFILDLDIREFRTIHSAGAKALQWPADLAIVGAANRAPTVNGAPTVREGSMLAVADSMQAAVFMFDMDGRFLRTIGEGVLQRPAALAWNAAAGELWVLDAALHGCIVFNLSGREVRRVGQRGESGGEFNFPAGMTYSEEVGVVVADSMNFRVQILDADGRPRRVFGRKGDAAGDFSLPRDVAVDSAGHIYVLDNQFENIQVFNASGQLLMAWGQEGRGPGEFYLPSGIFIDAQDRIWVADTYNRRVQVFQYLRRTGSANGNE